MRIATPVHNESLKVFANAGHAPFFAVFDINGAGKFRAAKLIALRANPRVNLQAEEGCEHENDPQEEPNEECGYESKKEELKVMTAILSDCAELVAAKACKNAKRAFDEAGVRVSVVGSGYYSAEDMISAFISRAETAGDK